MDLDVVWEDEHLLVVDKPAGVVVHPGAGHHERHARARPARARRCRGRRGPPGDRPSARPRHLRPARRRALRRGARAPAGADPPPGRRPALSRARQGHAALAHGTDRGSDRPRPRSTRRATRSTRPTPRDAVTHFEVLELLGPRALLELTLETGRTHQIRVHLEAIELLISGDPVYGVRRRPRARAPVPACGQARLRPPVHRRAGRRRVAAARPISQRRSSAPARLTPDRSYTARVRIPSVPATRTGGGAAVSDERFRPRPAGLHRNQP